MKRRGSGRFFIKIRGHRQSSKFLIKDDSARDVKE
jgi:hypothetical protein